MAHGSGFDTDIVGDHSILAEPVRSEMDPQITLEQIGRAALLELDAHNIYHGADHVQFDIDPDVDVPNGQEHRVYVRLSGNDTYSVEVGHMAWVEHEPRWVIKAQSTGVYAAQLSEAVLRLVDASIHEPPTNR
jgi:hypothetical protein